MQARSQYEEAQKQLDDLHKIGREQALNPNGQLAAAKGKFLGAQALLSYSRLRVPSMVRDRSGLSILAACRRQISAVAHGNGSFEANCKSAHRAVGSSRTKSGDAAETQLPGLDEKVKGRVSSVNPAVDPGR